MTMHILWTTEFRSAGKTRHSVKTQGCKGTCVFKKSCWWQIRCTNSSHAFAGSLEEAGYLANIKFVRSLVRHMQSNVCVQAGQSKANSSHVIVSSWFGSSGHWNSVQYQCKGSNSGVPKSLLHPSPLIRNRGVKKLCPTTVCSYDHG